MHYNIQHNPAISKSLLSKFRLYRSSIGSPARHNVNKYKRCSVISKLGYFEISVISKLFFSSCQSKAYRIYQTYIKKLLKTFHTRHRKHQVKLTQCFADIQSWCASMRLKLNASKMELIWFSNLAKENQPNLIIKIDENCLIKPSDVVHDLGVLLDNKLSMTRHISSVTKSCFFHLRRIRQIKSCLNESCLIKP